MPTITHATHNYNDRNLSPCVNGKPNGHAASREARWRQNIPAELRQLRQWVGWSLEIRKNKATGEEKETTVPKNPRTGGNALSTDSRTWGTFDEAIAAYQSSRSPRFDGIGFVFTKSDPYAGIDLDKCRNAETRVIDPWALNLIAELNTYTELSQSGKGVHAIARTTLPIEGHKKGHVEMYDRERFFCMTGQVLPGIGLPTIKTRDWSRVHARMMAGEFGGNSSDGGPRKRGESVPVDDTASGHDWHLLTELSAKTGVKTADELEAALREHEPGVYEQRNREKGNRGAKSYWRYTIERWVEGRERPTHPYIKAPDGLLWRRVDKRTGEVSYVKLTDFCARIVEDVIRDDGVEQTHHYLIESGDKRFSVPTKLFARMEWVAEQLAGGYILGAGAGVRDHARCAIEHISKEAGILRTRVYTHTGWRKIGEKWYYLAANGAVGAEGLVEVRCQLPGNLQLLQLPEPPSGDRLKEAVEASLRILKLGPRRIMFPAWAAIFRAVLGTCDFSEHFYGESDAFKTALLVLLLQHFGSGFDSDHLTASFASTENANEALQFLLKDAICGVDDFVPQGSRSEVDRCHTKADRLYRGQGNNAGRDRLRRDATFGETKVPRGLTIGTGEDMPRGVSLGARVLMLEFSRGMIDVKKLTAAQQDGRAGLYAESLSAFLAWLAPQYDQVRRNLRADKEKLRQEFANPNQHRRTPTMLADLLLGVRYFAQFAVQQRVLSKAEGQQLYEDALAAFDEVAAAQAEHQVTEKPAVQFTRMMAALFARGAVYLDDINKPRRLTSERQGTLVGWYDGQFLYLEPQLAYAEVQHLAQEQGRTLALTQEALWKRLDEAGLIAHKSKGPKPRLQLQKRFRGIRHWVLCLFPQAIVGAVAEPLDAEEGP